MSKNLTLQNQPSLEPSQLIKEDRVNRLVYVSDDIFQQEMDRIFENTWLYVGHESEIPKPGDYVTTAIGMQPVIVTRHVDGSVNVLHNRCGHRGAIVCNDERGNTGRSFRCGYHGWTFKTNGELLGAPLKNGYPECYNLKERSFGLVPVHVQTYRGFIFAHASSAEGRPDIDLMDHLGEMRSCIDLLCDRAPEGEIDLSGGVQKYYLLGNWKAQIENLNDLYHPPYSHESTTNKDGRQFVRRAGDQQGPLILDGDSPKSFWDSIRIYAFPRGHSYCGPLNLENSTKHDDDVSQRYRASLRARHSAARVDEILTERFHNAIFYPNLNIQLLSSHIRVIRPISVDKTEIRVYPVRLKGAPDEMYEAVVKYLNVTHSPASMIQTDDLEMFRRIQVGLRSKGTEWVVLGRGFGQEETEQTGLSSTGTSELPMRNQYRAWLDYMRDINGDRN